MREALKDIAILTASFFADVDLVASDILAGLLLVARAPNQSPSSTIYLPETEVISQDYSSIRSCYDLGMIFQLGFQAFSFSKIILYFVIYYIYGRRLLHPKYISVLHV